jgi:hypothetical protein
MVKIICLANSKKNGNRCIAGIDICTGKWVRPISNLKDGGVTKDLCSIDNQEPQPLDILDIPLSRNKGRVSARINKVVIFDKIQRSISTK